MLTNNSLLNGIKQVDIKIHGKNFKQRKTQNCTPTLLLTGIAHEYGASNQDIRSYIDAPKQTSAQGTS